MNATEIDKTDTSLASRTEYEDFEAPRIVYRWESLVADGDIGEVLHLGIFQ